MKGNSGSDWAFMIKRVKRQSALSHPVQHHSPLNSSCHLVSSASPRTDQVRENHRLPLTFAQVICKKSEFKFLLSRILIDTRFPKLSLMFFFRGGEK